MRDSGSIPDWMRRAYSSRRSRYAVGTVILLVGWFPHFGLLPEPLRDPPRLSFMFVFDWLTLIKIACIIKVCQPHNKNMTSRIFHQVKDYCYVKDLNGKRQEAGSIRPLLRECDACGTTRLSVAYSGLYYERRYSGWYLTSDTETCDLIHGLPAEGRLIKV